MKMTQAPAEGVFLEAFEVAIDQVHVQLAAAGLNESTIWTAFRRATAVLAEMSGDVDAETSRHANPIPRNPAIGYRPRRAVGE
jgi:hypothetical protein